VTTRRAQLFSLDSLSLDSRWKSSGLSVLIVMERETVEIAKQKTTFDTSYYVSNSAIESSSIQALTEELAGAIRFHWGVESNNWIRDVTFNEDHIKTKAGNQAQIMALLRGLAIELIRKTSPKNFQAAIEDLSDSIANLESMLRQVKFCGLLPNPQISYSFSAPSGGTDAGMNNAFGVGLSWQVTSLIWQESKISAAEKQQQSVDLHIAWQEWQIAQAAKLATYQLIVYTRQHALLTAMAQRLEDNRARLQQAAEEGLVTELERVAAVSAKNLVDIRLLALEQQQKQQQQRLNRTLGLKPYEWVKLQQAIQLASHISLPDYEPLITDIEARRLDLLALKQGYESQEERVHIAVLKQFPKISIGLNHALDNSNLYTMGFGVSMTLPIFDRNQGKIALERATRQQLFDQYSSRLFQARADIAELLVTLIKGS
jgi:outer membrane protein TolC/predicted transposase YbfD/YdcC